jgi:transcriptional regulator with XRE-family HTH domain
VGGDRWNAQTVRALRTALRMSQKEFGQHLGFAGRTIRRWEAGAKIPFNSQQMLDVALARASLEDKLRFTMIVEGKHGVMIIDAVDTEPTTEFYEP